MSPHFVPTVLCVLLSLLAVRSVSGQAIEKNGRDRNRFTEVEPGTSIFNARNNSRCNSQYRSFDGTCTNDIYKVAGSASTAQHTYFDGLSSTQPTGGDLPSARYISNLLCSQGANMDNRRRMSEFVVFFGQFLDHTFVASTTDGGSSFPIDIGPDDPVLANFTNGKLPFTRHKRAEPIPTNRNREREIGVERPVNLLSSSVDLASVYGSTFQRAEFLRSKVGGKLHVSPGNYLPFNTFGLSNAPSPSKEHFVAGDDRANEHPVLVGFHTLFMREHNKLAEELAVAFPEWNENKLFHEARKINIAQFQKIVYEEFFPTITGRRMRRSKGYRKNVLPAISIEFSTAAFRIGHTLVGNEVTRRGPNNTYMPPVPMSLTFFPRSQDMVKSGIDIFLRGAMYARAQEVDVFVSDMLRNFLFTNVKEVSGLDLIAFNIQRGRDHAVPSYNRLRRMFTLNPARRFRDITSNIALQNRLQTAYGTVDKVEAWIGLMAEDHIPGGSVGRTLYSMWVEEFGRLRDGDRFFYTRENLFPATTFERFPRLREILNGKNTMKKILLRNSGITESEMGNSVWFTQH